MEVSDRIAVMNTARIEQVGSPREIYDRPASQFVMSFVGPVSRVNGRLVRPHDVDVFQHPENGTLEAMVSRVVHLGFEVRIDLELPSGELARAQLTRAQTDELELTAGDIVYIRPPAGGVNENAGAAGADGAARADSSPGGEPAPATA